LAKKKTKMRMTRKEMKRDPLVTFSLRAADFSRMHARVLIIAGIVVVVSLVVIVMMVRDKAKAEADAELILTQANRELWSGNAQQATTLYEQLLDRYEGTDSGKRGLLFRGDALLETHSLDEAIASYEKFLKRAGRDDLLRNSARRGIATALEEKGEFGKAARVRENVALSVTGNEAAEELMAAARCYRAAAMYGQAIEIYDRVVKNHADYWGVNAARIAAEELRLKLKLGAAKSSAGRAAGGAAPDSN
jgi:tetratricopeptide (TPR) repeat protein